MRWTQLNENDALKKAELTIHKNFAPERKEVQSQVLDIARQVEMGKGDKAELLMKATAIAKSEQDLKRQDPDMKYSVDANIRILDSAIKKLTPTKQEESGLPPHLAKLFDKDGNPKNPKVKKKWDEFIKKKELEKKLQSKWIDVTPPGYGPADESCGSSHKKKKKVSEEARDVVRDYMAMGYSRAEAEAEARRRYPEEYGVDPNANRHVEVHINGKPWKVVAHKNIAIKIKATLEAKGKKIDLYYTDKPVSESTELEEAEGQKPYVCVHAKKGSFECHADTTYGAAKQAAEHWKLKSTAGIDVHLADKEMAWAEGIEESIDLHHNLKPGTYKHNEESITVTINNDGSVSFKQPAEWEIEGDAEYLEFVEAQLADTSNWTASVKEDSLMGVKDPVVVILDQRGKYLDKMKMSDAAKKYNFNAASVRNQLKHQDSTKIGQYTISAPIAGQPMEAELAEAAPGALRTAGGIATAALTGVGGALIGQMFAPFLGATAGGIAGAIGGYKAGTGATDALWDKVAELFGSKEDAKQAAMVHAQAAAAGEKYFEFNGKKYPVTLKPQDAQKLNVAEATWINGKKQDDKELVWKQTSISYEEACEKYGKENCKIGGKTGTGKDAVLVKVPRVAEEKAGWSIKGSPKPAPKQPTPHWRLNKDGTSTDLNTGITYNRDGSVVKKKEGVAEGTDLGQLGNGVLLNQFNMGKGVVGLQITSNKNTGYVHLDLDAAKDLQKKLDQWIGMRDRGELARPGDMDESIAEEQGCWDGYAPGAQSGVKTKPGTGKNKGKRVNNCEPIKAKK